MVHGLFLLNAMASSLDTCGLSEVDGLHSRQYAEAPRNQK
jgi:hypothetical protein